jgi:hypothetical protein
MEIIFIILCVLEYLEGLVKLARKKRNEVLQSNKVATIASIVPTFKIININKICNKTIHLLMEMNNYIKGGLINIRALMSSLLLVW